MGLVGTRRKGGVVEEGREGWKWDPEPVAMACWAWQHATDGAADFVQGRGVGQIGGALSEVLEGSALLAVPAAVGMGHYVWVWVLVLVSVVAVG